MEKHGGSNSRLYGIWNGVIQRCTNSHRKAFSRYGGRGITICEEWHNFQAFYDWAISNGYSDDLTIDRIDNDGNYEPSNCRWVNYAEQANNRRTNKIFEIDGVSHTLKEWTEIYGISYKTVWARVFRDKWDILCALTVPITSKGGTKHGRYSLYSERSF